MMIRQLSLAVFLTGFSVSAYALSYVGSAAVALSVGHDDNVRFVVDNPVSSMKIVVSPSAAVSVSAPRWGSSLSARYRDTNYTEASDERDSQQYRIDLRNRYALTETHAVRANFSTEDISSLDEVFGVDTGATTIPESILKYRANLFWDAEWSDRWSTETSYRWLDINNDEALIGGFNDSTSQTVVSTTTHNLSSRWALTGTIVLSKFESPENSDISSDTVNLLGGFTYVAGPGFNVSLSVGRRTTTTERDIFSPIDIPGIGTVFVPGRETTDSKGLVYNGSLFKVLSPVSSILLLASQSVATDINGDQNEFTSFEAEYEYAFTSRLTGALNGKIGNTISADPTLDDVNERDSQEVSVRLSYQYSPELLILGTVSKVKSELATTKEVKERQQMNVSVSYRFNSLLRMSR